MGPPVNIFPAAELPERIQTTLKDRRRKDKVELEKCELLEMLQYECVVEDEGRDRDSRIICQPIQRLFRRCQDRNGSFTVETTAWEGEKIQDNGKAK